MGKINDLPPLERPREKAFRYGVNNLSNIELLAILIGSGYKENSSLDIAYAILSEKKGLYNAMQRPYEEFLQIKGIKKAKAIQLAACFELGKRYYFSKSEYEEINIDSDYIYQKYAPTIAPLTQEVLILIILNRQKQIVHEVKLCTGTYEAVELSFRDIFKKIILYNGFYFYILHNHPGNQIEPSSNDILLTSELKNEAKKIGFTMIDHLIITKDGYYSFTKKMKIIDKKYP